MGIKNELEWIRSTGYYNKKSKLAVEPPGLTINWKTKYKMFD